MSIIKIETEDKRIEREIISFLKRFRSNDIEVETMTRLEASIKAYEDGKRVKVNLKEEEERLLREYS